MGGGVEWRCGSGDERYAKGPGKADNGNGECHGKNGGAWLRIIEKQLRLDSDGEVVIAQVDIHQRLKPSTIRIWVINSNDPTIAENRKLLPQRYVRHSNFIYK